MPPHQYAPWTNPYAGSVSELLLRRGDVAAQHAAQQSASRARAAETSGAARARAAEVSGAAAARAAEASGAAWGNAIGSVGDVLSRGIQGYAKEREEAPRRAMQLEADQLTLTNARAQQAAQQRAAESASVLQSAQSSRLPPDQVKAQLAQLGRGDLIPIYEKAATDLESSRLSLQDSRNKVAAAEADYFGGMAAAIKRAQFDPLAVEWALSEAEADGHDVKEFRALLQTQPDKLPTIVDSLIEKSPTQRRLLGEEADRTLKTEQEKRAAEQARQAAADREADNRRQADAATETARHNRATEAAAAAAAARTGDNEPLVQVAGPNGTTIWVKRSDAVGKPAAQAARGVTGAERKTLGFFQRMLEAERNARAVEESVGGRDFAAEWAPGAWLENFVKSPEGQRYTQAQRTFTEARLRKESGAAIPQPEYDTDRETNFRRPNDDDQTIEQKRAARLRLLRSAANEAGRALQEYYGADQDIESLLSEFTAPASTKAGTVQVKAPDGQIYTFPNAAAAKAFREAAGF